MRRMLIPVLAVFACTIAWPAGTADATVPINFTRATLSGASFATANPTALEFGPDGRLYVADGSGRIQALTINPTTKAITAVQQITSATDLLEVYGIAFDPNDATSPPPVYVTNTISGFGDAGQAPPGAFSGKVTRISGPTYGTRTDVITGLPVGNSGHQANGLAFGPDGRLYIAQGSTTNAGVINPNAGLFQREEVPTSAALLVADLNAPGFDGNLTYSPADTYAIGVTLASGDVELYATGLRNPYDIAFHSNGRLYNTDNGPNSGYGPSSTSCTTDNGGDAQAADELNIIVEGGYYGHPNRNRGVAGDARQCVYHAGTDPSTAEYTAPIGLLPPSSNGLAEYKAGVFGGQMQGDLIYVSWVENTMRRVILSPDGSSVVADLTLASGLANALDLAIQPDGTIYVAEWGANRITYFRPDETPVSSISVTGISPAGGPIAGGQNVTITGTNFTTSAETTAYIGVPPNESDITNLVVHNSTTITGTTTSTDTTGVKPVTVTNSIGSASFNSPGYNYTAGGGSLAPAANAGSDWSGPIAHNDHAHAILDATGSVDSDGFIVSYEWSENGSVLSTSAQASIQFTLGEHLVTLSVTDNDGYTDTDQVRIIVTQFAENPQPYFCFDVDNDTDVDVSDVLLVAASYGSKFGDAGYGRMRDYNGDRVINSADIQGTLSNFTAQCPLVEQQIRDATAAVEPYQNINAAFAAGFIQVTPYIPGQGRHLVKGTSVTNALTQQDDVFELTNPESLLYEPDASTPGGWRLGGIMWILPTTLVPLVPAGFAGTEDAWHYHPSLCIWNNGNSVAENLPQASCNALPNAVWLEKAGWLLHLWTYHPNPQGRFVEENDALTDPPASSTAVLAVDANPSMPGTQPSANVAGSTFTVDIVASNINNVGAFNFDLTYNGAHFSAPAINTGPSTERNPDANQPFLDGTGRSFTCTPPDPATGLTSGTLKAARISCTSSGTFNGPNTGGAATIASVTFNVITGSATNSPIALKSANVFTPAANETAGCNPTVLVTTACNGAAITVTGTDTDGDGCSDAQEGGPDEIAGGQRNPNDPWDFFDTTGDRSIDLNDAVDVLMFFGDDGTSPAGNMRDRAMGPMGYTWRTVEANDGVDLTDAMANLEGFGHSCGG